MRALVWFSSSSTFQIACDFKNFVALMYVTTYL